MKIRLTAVALALVLAAAACQEATAPDVHQQPPEPNVDSLTVWPLGLTVPANVSLGFRFQPWEGSFPQGHIGACAHWASSDTTVATVSTGSSCGGWGDFSGGTEVRTHRAGTAVISVAYAGAQSAATLVVLPALQFVSISAGSQTCALTAAGAAFCWTLGGRDPIGLGGGSWCRYLCPEVPRLVAGGLSFVTLTTNAERTCALISSGAAFCWGQVYGNVDYVDAPAAVPGDVAFTAISVGYFHTCGIAADSTAYCWGQNEGGQLGDGTVQSSTTPVRVAGDLRFTAIGAGYRHTCGLVRGGAPYCWGYNENGELGDGGRIASSVPVRVSGGLTLVALSAQGDHACGLTAGGAAYCWGANSGGQLGVSPISDSTCVTFQGYGACSDTPVLVAGSQSFRSIATGFDRTCGLTASGDAYCWGTFFAAGPCRFVCNRVIVPIPERVPATVPFDFRGGGLGDVNCWMGRDGAAYCWGKGRGSVPWRVPGQAL